MRQAFLLLDFEDPSVEPFKAMLLSATLQPLYLNMEEVSFAMISKAFYRIAGNSQAV